MENQTKIKVKKVLGIILNVFLWMFVVFALVVTVVAVSANANKKSVPTIGGNCYLTVLSDSMNADKPDSVDKSKPSGFKKNDLIIGKYIADNQDEINKLEVGDVITFEYDIDRDGKIVSGEYNTHRIVEIVMDGDKVKFYRTQGDNFEYSHGATEEVYAARIIAKYTGKKIGGVGVIFTGLRKPAVFGFVIILPLAAFFVYELIVFIKAVLKVKNEGKKVITAEDEELIKQRAIEEYLSRKEKEQSSSAPAPEEEGKE